MAFSSGPFHLGMDAEAGGEDNKEEDDKEGDKEVMRFLEDGLGMMSGAGSSPCGMTRC